MLKYGNPYFFGRRYRRRMAKYCACCLEVCEPCEFVQEIDDWHYGRPGVQRHEHIVSSCCGEDVLTYIDMVREKWEIRCRMRRIDHHVERINALTGEIARYDRRAA